MLTPTPTSIAPNPAIPRPKHTRAGGPARAHPFAERVIDSRPALTRLLRSLLTRALEADKAAEEAADRAEQRARLLRLHRVLQLFRRRQQQR